MAIELAKAYVQIVPSAEGIKSALSDIFDQETAGLGERVGGSIGKKLVGAISSVVSTAAIGKLIADSITAGGALEQSIGGIETLFGDAFETVKANAEQAYKTVGLSANAYMEQSTSFAASLVSSVSGNTEAAAQLADIALRDMADNANKMGTPLESIQNAYQGLAKSNYTMIDNLKLGYGGTQAEMERLLADATALSGVEYELGNLADMYVAIHTIQEELGITGTTAAEAAGTLSGSFASMGAAWQNVMGSLALGDGLTENLEAFVDTAQIYLVDNLLPMLTSVVGNIPQIVYTVVPELISTGTGLVQSLAEGFVQGVPEFFSTALPQLLSFTDELRANVGGFIDAGINMISQLLNGIIAGLPQLFAYVPDIIINIAGLINDNAPKLLVGGVNLIVQLANGIWQAAKLIPQHFGKIMEAALAVISAINWVSMGGKIITGIGNGIKSMGSSLLNAVKSAFSSPLEWISSLPSKLWQLAKDILESFKNGLQGKGAVAATANLYEVVASADYAANKSAAEERKALHDERVRQAQEEATANGLLADSTVEMAQIAIPEYTKTAAAASGVTAAVTTAAKSMSELVKEELAALKLSSVTLPDAFAQQADRLASLEAAYTAASEDVDKLTYLLNEEIKASGAASEKSQYLFSQLKTAENTLDSAKKALDEYKDSLDATKTAASGLADSINQTINAVSGFGGKLSSLGDKLGLGFLSGIGDWLSDLSGGADTVIQFAASVQTLSVAMQGLKAAMNTAQANGGASVITAALSELIGADTDVIAPLVEKLTGLLGTAGAAMGTGAVKAGLGLADLAAGADGLIGTALAGTSGLLTKVGTLVMANPEVAAVAAIALGAVGLGTAIWSKFGRRSKTDPAAGTKNDLSYREIQDAYWYGNERAFAGYDYRTDPYTYNPNNSAVMSYQSKMQAQIERLCGVVERYLPDAAKAQLVLEDGTLVGAMAPGMNQQLGTLAVLAERGN